MEKKGRKFKKTHRRGWLEGRDNLKNYTGGFERKSLIYDVNTPCYTFQTVII